MAYTDSSTDNYASAAYTNAYTLTHSTPMGHSHGGGVPPAFHSGETGGPPNSVQLGASAQEHTGTGRITSHHAGHHRDPGGDLGPEEIERNNHAGCQAKIVPAPGPRRAGCTPVCPHQWVLVCLYPAPGCDGPSRPRGQAISLSWRTVQGTGASPTIEPPNARPLACQRVHFCSGAEQ